MKSGPCLPFSQRGMTGGHCPVEGMIDTGSHHSNHEKEHGSTQRHTNIEGEELAVPHQDSECGRVRFQDDDRVGSTLANPSRHT